MTPDRGRQVIGGVSYPTNEVGGADVFTREPVEPCPRCGSAAHAEFCDNGFGPYSVQVGPYHCDDCGWTESRAEDHPVILQPELIVPYHSGSLFAGTLGVSGRSVAVSGLLSDCRGVESRNGILGFRGVLVAPAADGELLSDCASASRAARLEIHGVAAFNLLLGQPHGSHLAPVLVPFRSTGPCGRWIRVESPPEPDAWTPWR